MQMITEPANRVTTGSVTELAALNRNSNPEDLPNRRKSNNPGFKTGHRGDHGFGVRLSDPEGAKEPFQEVIPLGLTRGRNARTIWQDPVSDHGFGVIDEANCSGRRL